MKTEVKKWLLDALNACQAISSFTNGKDFAEYERDLLLRSGVERQLEIVGDALNKALSSDPSIVKLVPDVRRIIGLRNRIIHGYDTVDNQTCGMF